VVDAIELQVLSSAARLAGIYRYGYSGSLRLTRLTE